MTPHAPFFEIASAEGRVHLGDLADGIPVFSMKGDDHLQAHPEMAALLPRLFAMVSYGDFTGREHDREFDLGVVVGHSRCVATTDADEIVYARRTGRRQGWTPFVKGREAIPTSTVSIRFLQTDSGLVALLTAHFGTLAPPERVPEWCRKNPSCANTRRSSGPGTRWFSIPPSSTSRPESAPIPFLNTGVRLSISRRVPCPLL